MNLFRQTVLITRDVSGNKRLARRLRGLGARVISWPGFEFVEVPTNADLKDRLKKIHEYDWIVFTSQRAVFYFFRSMAETGADRGALKMVKTAAVGPVTAQAVENKGLAVNLVSSHPSSAGLAREETFLASRGLKIFLPCARDAKSEFAEIHADRHTVHVAVLYEKRPVHQSKDAVAKLSQTPVDWVLFFSPSAVDCFLGNFEGAVGIDFLKKTRVAVIGGTTARRLEKMGVSADVVSWKSTVDDMLKFIR